MSYLLKWLGKILLYVVAAALWLLVGFQVAIYEADPSTRYLAFATGLFFAAISAATLEHHVLDEDDPERAMSRWAMYLFTAAGLACLAYDFYLRHGGKPFDF